MVANISVRAYHFSVVAVGPMNPRLHHPLWYRLIGAISEEEEAAAVASSNLILIQPLGRFELAASGITVQCQESRWEVIATQPSQRERIKDIASIVFKKLYETPITIFGFNNNFEVETSVTNVRRCLADSVVSLDLGFGAEGDGSCTIRFSDLQKTRRTQISIGPSELSQDVLSFGFNSQYNTRDEVGKDPGYFDLGDLIARHYNSDYEVAVDLAARFVANLGQRCGGH